MEGVVLYVTLVKVLVTNKKAYIIAFTATSYSELASVALFHTSFIFSPFGNSCTSYVLGFGDTIWVFG